MLDGLSKASSSQMDFVVLRGDPLRYLPQHPVQPRHGLPGLPTSHWGEPAAQQWALEQLQRGKILQQLQAYDFYLESLQFEAPFP